MKSFRRDKREESGRRLPHSMTLARNSSVQLRPRGCGVRQCYAALLIATTLGIAGYSIAQERAPDHKPIVVLVGDSTVTETSGWGLGFKRYLNDNAPCTNMAANGRSSKSFIHEGRWKQALALKGDYYLIQFGHNDEHGKGPDRETDANTTYHDFMARYVD